jgi:hypothetical protein
MKTYDPRIPPSITVGQIRSVEHQMWIRGNPRDAAPIIDTVPEGRQHVGDARSCGGTILSALKALGDRGRCRRPISPTAASSHPRNRAAPAISRLPRPGTPERERPRRLTTHVNVFADGLAIVQPALVENPDAGAVAAMFWYRAQREIDLYASGNSGYCGASANRVCADADEVASKTTTPAEVIFIASSLLCRRAPRSVLRASRRRQQSTGIPIRRRRAPTAGVPVPSAMPVAHARTVAGRRA